mmetsp:Transcript_36743/g.87307  ORF Transcript_36743/g.87307 Transcript_36743/m.87307 type:complete len:83 (+) Transcript_36743:614-862(+)
MSEAVGLQGLHSVSGVCDLCGSDCYPDTQELNALDCTFQNCPSESNVYHQDCLERYLKSIKLEKYCAVTGKRVAVAAFRSTA